MKKSFIVVIIVSLSTLLSCHKDNNDKARSKEEVEKTVTTVNLVNRSTFENTVFDVLNAFENSDSLRINKYVSKDEGVVVIFRTGVFNEYLKTAQINFSNPIPPTFPYPSLKINRDIRYEALPTFDCGTMEWSKYGVYCDTVRKDTLLSGTPLNLRKYRGDKIDDSEIDKFRQIESLSRRIVVAAPNGDLIFYLTLLKNKWFITAIDRITTDCSA